MELLILINSLLYGNASSSNKGFSLPVKTISEIIIFNHKKSSSRNSTSKVTRQRHRSEKETPFVQYLGLKLYSAVRSRGIVDVLFENMDCVFHMIEFYALHKVLARHLCNFLKMKMLLNLEF